MDIPALPFCRIKLKAKKPVHIDYPKSLITLGDHIRIKRLDLKLQQKDVARILGVSTCAVHNWERQRDTPKLPLIPLIHAFLGYAPYKPCYTLPERLKACREGLGLSQEKLAKELGVDENTVFKWETGRSRPTEDSLKRIEEFLIRLKT